jgi:thiol-disulfide isomerase/thioredoxin
MKKQFVGLLLLCCLPLACTSNENTADADISLVDLNGKVQSLKAYHGQWLLINYWATWCPPCLREIPHLVDAVQLLDNIQVFGMNTEKISKESLQQFVNGQMISYPVIMLGAYQDRAQQQAFLQKYPIPRGLPTSYLINPEGRLVQRYEGSITLNQIEALIKP